jgi:pimeloyl-ACP methyl ester carboxylesterase
VALALLLAMWPTRPPVSPLDSQDKYVELGPQQGFDLKSVPLFSAAHVKVLHNTLRYDGRATIVFLHGFPDNVYSFSNQMMFFRKEYNVLALSLRGYDSTSAVNISGSLSLANLAADVILVLDYFQLTQPVHIVGHDWGSLIAQWVVKAHPERFETVSLLAVPHLRRSHALSRHPAQLINSWYTMFFQLPFAPEWWFSRNDFAGFETLFRSWGNGINPNPERIASIKRTFREGNESVVTAIIGYYRQNIFQMLIAGIKRNWGSLPASVFHKDMPRRTLQLYGERDWCMLPQLWDSATNRSDFKEGVDTVKIVNAGHFLHQEAPDEVNKLILHMIVDHGKISRL